jgi:ribulose-phosphate 3-epimerase
VHLDRQLNRIKELGCMAGVSINPATSLTDIEEVLHLADLVLLMSVNPGFGGQAFIDGVLRKVERLASVRKMAGHKFLIQVDGGVNADNIGEISRAGCDVFVAGNAVFGQKDRAAALKKLQREIEGGRK